MNLNNLFGPSGTNESLADEFAAMAKAKGMNVRIAGTPAQERERTQQHLAQRAAERKKTDQATAKQDFANLADLESQFKQMKTKYDALGGSNWQYADREQNLTSSEREARDMEYGLNILGGRIARAKQSQGVAEASYINGKVQDPTSLRWKQTSMTPQEAISKFGKENVRVERGVLRNGGDMVEVRVPLGEQGVAEGSLNEFAPSAGGDGSGNYFQELASAWYNSTFDSNSLQKGIKSQQDVERLLQRGIVCPDGVTRKFGIDYNSDFDGVVISSDDYYEHADHDETDSRTGKPFGPYDYMEFGGEELDESAQWRDSKYKGQLYTQEPPDYNNTREYDNARWNPKPKGYLGRKELPDGGEFPRTDPLVRGAGIGRTGIKHNINLSGKRKGLPSRDQITSLKQSIRDVHGRHTRANLPEQGVEEGADDKFSVADKVEELVDQYRLYDKRGWTDLFTKLAGRKLEVAEIRREMEYASKFLDLLDSIRMRSDYRGQQDPRLDQELIDLSNQWLGLFNKATGEFKGMSGQGVMEGGAKDRQWSNKDMERLRVATRDFDDIMASDGPEATKQNLIKKRIQTKPMAGPKGVLPEQGVEEGLKSKMVAAALTAANLLGSPVQAAEEPVKPITIAYVTIDGEVKKYNLGDKFTSSTEAEKFISGVLDKQGLQGYQLEIKRGYPKQKNEDAAEPNTRTDRILKQLRTQHPQAESDLEALIYDFRMAQSRDRRDIGRLDQENDAEEQDISFIQKSLNLLQGQQKVRESTGKSHGVRVPRSGNNESPV